MAMNAATVLASEKALASLLEVPCVEGSFLVGKDGEVCAWNMPTVEQKHLRTEVHAKLARLRKAFLIASERLDFCSAPFGQYKLCLQVGAGGMLCIFARNEVNLTSLRTAATSLMQQLPRGAAA